MTTEDCVDECRTAAALYSIGALPPDESARFEQRLKSGCPLCTSEHAGYAAVTVEMTLNLPTQEPGPPIRHRLMERIATPEAHSRRDAMTLVRGGDTPWMLSPYPGIEVRPLRGRDTLLVRMQPGAVYPSHEHRAAEQCYVLEGSVTDSSGMTAFAGDFVCMAAGSTHQDIRTETGCVFLLAYTS